jgi:hypothetical protein
MANLLYRDHFIIASADMDDTAGSWKLTVDISWRIDGGRQFLMLYPSHSYTSKAESESFGLEAGKTWIDKHRLSPASGAKISVGRSS